MMNTLNYYIGDCQNLLNNFNDIDCIITDPPYNINWKYPGYKDNQKEKYRNWIKDIFLLSYESLSKNGISIWINYPENNNLLFSDINDYDINFIQQLIWSYPTNVGHSKNKYTRSHRTILIYSKNKKYTFNPIKQSYKNPSDKRIKN